MTWRYVAAREVFDGEEIWTVRELYEDDGKLSWTAGSVAPHGSCWLDLNEDISRMGTALASSEFLDLAADPPALAMRKRRQR
jgi:hypothetical protein